MLAIDILIIEVIELEVRVARGPAIVKKCRLCKAALANETETAKKNCLSELSFDKGQREALTRYGVSDTGKMPHALRQLFRRSVRISRAEAKDSGEPD